MASAMAAQVSKSQARRSRHSVKTNAPVAYVNAIMAGLTMGRLHAYGAYGRIAVGAFFHFLVDPADSVCVGYGFVFVDDVYVG